MFFCKAFLICSCYTFQDLIYVRSYPKCPYTFLWELCYPIICLVIRLVILISLSLFLSFSFHLFTPSPLLHSSLLISWLSLWFKVRWNEITTFSILCKIKLSKINVHELDDLGISYFYNFQNKIRAPLETIGATLTSFQSQLWTKAALSLFSQKMLLLFPTLNQCSLYILE